MLTPELSDYHGQIRCGTISVSDLDRSLSLYRDKLDQAVVEQGKLSNGLAQSWGSSHLENASYALLQPKSGSLSFLRLIEVPDYPGYEAAKTFGWNAFEISVRDVFELAQQIENSAFDIVGPPRLVDGFTSFIPMQVVGPDGEVLFLNQVNHSEQDVDLPKANSEVDTTFIVVLAAIDRQQSVKEYVENLALDETATHKFRYSLINRAFGLPEDTQQTITMVQKDRLPFLQVDQYPSSATHRPCHAGSLPAGNSMVSIMVDDIDALPVSNKLIAPARTQTSKLYRGQKSAVIRGSSTELLELIEIG